jgi:hypothetical protein
VLPLKLLQVRHEEPAFTAGEPDVGQLAGVCPAAEGVGVDTEDEARLPGSYANFTIDNIHRSILAIGSMG